VILSDRQIEAAIREGRIIVDPLPGHGQYDSSALNLRVGEDFLVWKESLRVPGTRHCIDLDNIDLAQIIDLTDPLPPNSRGLVIIEPGAFVLVLTREYIHLPIKAKLAARVEGRSKQARFGMTAHITAPTIHAGFSGRVVLEILNHGPFELEVCPNESMLCQLIFEEVGAVPQRGGSPRFSGQTTPLGTPKPRKPKPR
jgi:dCTP deaminase